jgi:hypothetical protein
LVKGGNFDNSKLRSRSVRFTNVYELYQCCVSKCDSEETIGGDGIKHDDPLLLEVICYHFLEEDPFLVDVI